jgi:hypothetical protein
MASELSKVESRIKATCDSKFFVAKGYFPKFNCYAFEFAPGAALCVSHPSDNMSIDPDAPEIVYDESRVVFWLSTSNGDPSAAESFKILNATVRRMDCLVTSIDSYLGPFWTVQGYMVASKNIAAAATE